MQRKGISPVKFTFLLIIFHVAILIFLSTLSSIISYINYSFIVPPTYMPPYVSEIINLLFIFISLYISIRILFRKYTLDKDDLQKSFRIYLYLNAIFFIIMLAVNALSFKMANYNQYIRLVIDTFGIISLMLFARYLLYTKSKNE